ncbi:MAG: hypothetical protein ONB05_06650 [candidate division KSB1 bacterium]|nr:hypothetical protein [candidate division KSB1 bacterium]
MGIELHQSSPLLHRISLFYPVANSLDLSTDYWRRHQFRVMSLGLKIGNKPKQWLGLEPFDYQVTPYWVTFHKQDQEKTIDITYEFCKNKPAMVARFEITNNLAESELFEIYTHLEASLRTCHTYTLKDNAWTEFDSTTATSYLNFDDPETGKAQIFVANAGERPVSFTTEETWWKNPNSALPGEIIDQATPKRPVAAFVYRKNLAPRQTMSLVQIIGSCQMSEGRGLVEYLLTHYERETHLYQQYVLNKAYREGVLQTGDSSLDHSAHWAKAILATNAHYLDGQIVPMPCPAEYNFFFTHDVLLTDLAAVHFDIPRVKQDLEFIIKQADAEQTIPHAYYWKDDRYVTEVAGPDNWNHFWFVLVSASYLRHSGDVPTLKRLYPYISRSIQLALSNKQADDLIWAYRPDWWDIGRSFGPRAYMTILAIRALREYLYISTALEENLSELAYYEDLASRMQRQLTEKLWDKELNYLINYYEDGTKDPHLYIGSLLAAHFDLIDNNQKAALVQTASCTLLDKKLGIYNVFPMDFHLLRDYLRFSGNEAGDPFIYANGGIWFHGTAWYVLALISIGKNSEALQVIKNTMTLEGIMTSPNGQPAMYEYRNSNYQDSSVYGKIDKPQFLWAAGWYLYSLYRLLGSCENEWNLSFEPYLLPGQKTARYSLAVKGRTIPVDIMGAGRYIKNIKYDGKPWPTAVIPEKLSGTKKVKILLGAPEFPYLASTSSILLFSRFNKKERSLVLGLKAFPGHANETEVISSWNPKKILINGIELTEGWNLQRDNGIYQVNIRFLHP